MKRGLYAWAGASATASAAAWARRLESPMTNCSNVSLGLKEISAAGAPTAAAIAPGRRGAESAMEGDRMSNSIWVPATLVASCSSGARKRSTTQWRISVGATTTIVEPAISRRVRGSTQIW